MNTQGIVQIPHPVLHKVCRPVVDFDDPGFKQTVKNLLSAARREGRKGVAAPQIGVDLAMFAVNLRDVRHAAFGPVLFVNPSRISASGFEWMKEGCLSVAERWFEVKRPSYIEMEAYHEDGNMFTLCAYSVDAQALQHEFDHLQGILVVDRAKEQLNLLQPRQRRRVQERELAKVKV